MFGVGVPNTWPTPSVPSRRSVHEPKGNPRPQLLQMAVRRFPVPLPPRDLMPTPTATAASLEIPRDIPFRVRLPDDREADPLDGFPLESFILSFSMAELCRHGYVDSVLAKLMDGLSAPVEMLDKKYLPALAQILKPCTDESWCVAACPALDVWGVGVGTREVNKVTSARVALALHLFFKEEEHRGVFSEDFPTRFLDMVDAARVASFPTPGRKKRRLMCEQVSGDDFPREALVPLVPFASARAKSSCAREDLARLASCCHGQLPRDVPLWIEIPKDTDMPQQLRCFPRRALVVATECKTIGIYFEAEMLLQSILPPSTKVEYVDDAQWSLFPEIGVELRKLAPMEECFSVGVISDVQVWAVGVAMKNKNRTQVSRAALAAAMAIAVLDRGHEVDFTNAPSFSEFVRHAREKWSRSRQQALECHAPTGYP